MPAGACFVPDTDCWQIQDIPSLRFAQLLCLSLASWATETFHISTSQLNGHPLLPQTSHQPYSQKVLSGLLLLVQIDV